ASQSGGNDGIGFAVPINIAKKVMKSIIKNGHVTRGYLGITLGGEVDDIMAKALDLDKPYGIIVGDVNEGDPADQAGIKENDVIQSINGEPVKSWMQLRTAIGTSSPGAEVDFTVVRDGETKKLAVTLGEVPQDSAQSSNQSSDKSMDERIGFKVQNLTPDIARQLRLDSGQEGVVVTQVARGSSAQQQGLQQGAVITEVDRQPIGSVSEFREAIEKAADGDDNVVLLKVLQGSVSQYIAFEL